MSSDSGREKDLRSERKKRRNRSSNFSTREKEILIGLIGKQINIILSKRTDSVAVQEKEAAWTKIAYEFNNNPSVVSKRDTKSLKSWYDNFKRKVKNKLAENGSDESTLDAIEHKFVGALLEPDLESNGENVGVDFKIEVLPFIKTELNGVSDDSSDRLVICEDQQPEPSSGGQDQPPQTGGQDKNNRGRWRRRRPPLRSRCPLSGRFYLRAVRSLRVNAQLKRAILNQKLQNERLLAEVLRKKLQVLEAKLIHYQKEDK